MWQQLFKVHEQKHGVCIDQLIHDTLLEYSPSVDQMLLQLWQNEITLNT